MTPSNQGQWVSIIEYANRNQISISTLRRYIKKNKISYQTVEGKYLIWEERCQSKMAPDSDSESLTQLKEQLQAAQQEILELKMLVDLYEQKLSPSHSPSLSDHHHRFSL